MGRYGANGKIANDKERIRNTILSLRGHSARHSSPSSIVLPSSLLPSLLGYDDVAPLCYDKLLAISYKQGDKYVTIWTI